MPSGLSPTEPDAHVVEAYYKSQPTALNLAYNTIPEDDVWKSSPIVYPDPGLVESDRLGDGMLFEIDLEDVQPVLPPDGGWGWLVAFGSFMCMILVDGVCFSYGVFLSELEATFGATKMQMTLAGSLLTGCYFMVGPLVSGLMNRFGARVLVIIGSIVSSLAIIGSSFAQDVNTFIGIFGVIGGVGYGLLYLPAATIFTTWFVKKRATVNGIVTAGSGIGVVCYSIAIPHLIRAYSWRGCLLLLAAVNLNAIVAGALFRPLLSTESEVDKKKQTTPSTPLVQPSEQAFTALSRTSFTTSQSKSVNIVPLPRKKSSFKHPSVRLPSDFESADKSHSTDDTGAHFQTGLNEVTFRLIDKREAHRLSNISCENVMITHGNQLIPVPEETVLPTGSTDRLPMLSMDAVNHIVEEVLNRQVIASTTNLAQADRPVGRKSSGIFNFGSSRWFTSTTSQLGQVAVRPTDTAAVYFRPDNMGSATYFASAVSLRTAGESGTGALDEGAVRDAIVQELRREISRPVHKKDLFLGGSLMQLNEFVAKPDVEAYIRSVTIPAEVTHAKNPIVSMLRSLFDVSILRSPTFQLLNISSILSMVGYIVPYQFLKDNAQSLGFPEDQSAYLLAYLGGLNTLSRALSGLLSDQPWTDVILVNNVSLLLSGLGTALVPLFTTYSMLLFFACFYGFVIAAFIAVRTILIVKVLGLDRLTNAFGFFLLFQGVAIVGAPPLFGALYDASRTFSYVFILGGIALFLSGLLCFPLKTLSRWEMGADVQVEVDCNETPGKSGTIQTLRRWCACLGRCHHYESKNSINTQRTEFPL